MEKSMLITVFLCFNIVCLNLVSFGQCHWQGYDYPVGQTVTMKSDNSQWKCVCVANNLKPFEKCIVAEWVQVTPVTLPNRIPPQPIRVNSRIIPELDRKIIKQDRTKAIKIYFFKVDNQVKIYRSFNGSREDTILISPVIEHDPDLGSDKITCVLLPVNAAVGVYSFRVQVINSYVSNEPNPWNIVAHICTVDSNDSALPDDQSRLIHKIAHRADNEPSASPSYTFQIIAE